MPNQLFWAPTAVWRISEGALYINGRACPSEFIEIFPEFYFQMSVGASVDEILAGYPQIRTYQINEFILGLVKQGVLVSSIQDPFTLFASQQHLFAPHDPFCSMPLEEKSQLDFVSYALQRNQPQGDCIIQLDNQKVSCENALSRRSTREFDYGKPVGWEQFSKLFAILRPRDDSGNKYYYSSAGGLYPIDYYVYIKPDRVDYVEGGLYRYAPISNELSLIYGVISEMGSAHYFSNRDIFHQSAFSMFFVYCAAASMPKYNGLGYLLALVDCGVVTHALNLHSEECSLGSCSIGEMDFARVESFFQLSPDQKFLQAMEFGYKK